MSRRKNVYCNTCLTSIYVSRDSDGAYSVCGFCQCYQNGDATPEQALETIQGQKNISAKKARELQAMYLRVESQTEHGLRFPRGAASGPHPYADASAPALVSEPAPVATEASTPLAPEIASDAAPVAPAAAQNPDRERAVAMVSTFLQFYPVGAKITINGIPYTVSKFGRFTATLTGGRGKEYSVDTRPRCTVIGRKDLNVYSVGSVSGMRSRHTNFALDAAGKVIDLA